MTMTMGSSSSPVLDVRHLAGSLKKTWREAGEPHLLEAIREYPELASSRSVLVELAYEAYCLEESRGHRPETEEFVRQLPAFRSQVREVIFGHRELADHPEIFEGLLPAWPEVGQEIEGIELVQELGRGAFSRVYLGAESSAGHRQVALKVSPNPSSEGYHLGSLEQNSIAGIHWVRRRGGLQLICMPYRGRTTLADVIAEVLPTAVRNARPILDTIGHQEGRPLVGHDPALLFRATDSYFRAVARLARSLAEALAYLHGRGLIHGDIKPSNIILDRSARPCLIDFNLAQKEGERAALRGGTLPYMSPEALTSGVATFCHYRAELYSLGVVLFEMLTGRVPHEPILGTPAQVARDLARRKASGSPDVRSFNPRVPAALSRIVADCLAPVPERRPSAQELASRLARFDRSKRTDRLALAAVLGLALTACAWGSLRGDRSSERFIPDVPLQGTPEIQINFLSRGMEHLQAGDVASAHRDFDTHRRLTDDPRAYACLGYCLTRSGQHRAAEAMYGRSIDLGFAPAWVHNNRAYSLMKYNAADAEQMRRAMTSARQAIEIDPTLRPARLNSIYAAFSLSRLRKEESLRQDEVVRELEAVLAAGPVDAETCYRAALIFSTSGSDRRAQSMFWARRSIELGRQPAQICNDPVLRRHLFQNPEFEALRALPVPTAPAAHLDLQVCFPAL